ncbi:MAG: prephenate dehydrogenase [Thermoanaerobaculia bacterium]|nr:prephenate dehydrogenase [Thermoanaerobaculia bacterium]
MNIGIIGLGLIGGSIAIDLKNKGSDWRVVGADQNPAHAAQALALNMVHEIRPISDVIKQADLIVVATPVNSLIHLIPEILSQINDHQTVVDVGSTKWPVVQATEQHPKRARFVAAHPMAGTEYSGPHAAVPDLFVHKCCVLCNPRDSAPDALDTARNFFELLGMRIVALDAREHDLHVAYVSHISHIASFALALTVLEKEREENRIFDLASGGFSSTVRLAKSNPDTWTPIFQQNRDHVLDVLDEYINTISRFRTLLIKRDFNTFHQLIRHANDIRRIIG